MHADQVPVGGQAYVALEAGTAFQDPALMADLDVRFANLWLQAYDAAAAGRQVPKAWDPLFDHRAGAGRLPIQYALSGMNTHIEHDLPIALVQTLDARGSSLHRRAVHEDYEAVNDVLAQVEAEIRRLFLTEAGQELDDRIGAVVHLVSAWKIDKARDVAWLTAETIWAIKRHQFLLGGYLGGLGSTVGMASRILLTPLML